MLNKVSTNINTVYNKYINNKYINNKYSNKYSNKYNIIIIYKYML